MEADMTTRSEPHYGGMACSIGHCTATEICPHQPMTTRSDTERLLREALIRTCHELAGSPPHWGPEPYCERFVDGMLRALATPPDTDPVCTCGPWKIGQPYGHLPGCPREQDAEGRYIVPPDTDPSVLGDALPTTEAGRRLYEDKRIDNQAQRVKADDRHDKWWLDAIRAIEDEARAAIQESRAGGGLDVDAAWEALLDDIGHYDQAIDALARHRPIIEAAIRARLEVNINTLVREAHEARAAIQESRAEVALDPKRQAALERVVDDVVARHESRAGGGLVTEESLAEALRGIHPGPRPFPGQVGGASAAETAAAIIARLSPPREEKA